MSTTADITEWFNRGPLTTTFTPPTSCLQTASTVVYYVNDVPGTTTFYGHWWTTGIQCLPTGTMPESLLGDATYWGTYWCKTRLGIV
ncbi:hypothetical protein N7510_008969 [Penicillium lagena]|uniref:uncharacterized protein n=1 Tax=Penicillium lagena TaxID=94218 RepID=UPI002540F9D4|nr:uncharacterized protein N7510_008969 [Penicillium lagena]KAJ5606188.1 hypothetical protein N7510_008969 [Penicillium lagena]